MANDRVPTRVLGGLLLGSAFIALLIGWDLIADYRDGVELWHILIECLVLAVAGGMFFRVLTLLLRDRRRLRQVNIRLDSARAESWRWRTRYQQTIRGLGAAIQEQFERWQLSAAEGEIALLLLKGLSFKEIAVMRGTGERTVREQARAIYRKAGLAGRSELAAFFLEDLLLPGVSPLTDQP